jgi:hypothetical protein
MKPFRDDELINHPALRCAIEAHRAAEPGHARSRHWPIGWLLIGVVVIGVMLIVLIGQLHPAG